MTGYMRSAGMSNLLKVANLQLSICCRCNRTYSTLKDDKKILFSGIQPTGVPHLGNYLGAVKNWVKLQDNNDKLCIFSVVDLHSLTKPAEPEKRRLDITDTVITLLACGIDPERAILFQQSDVKEHAELCWILTCMVTEPRLKQIPQWKEKAKLVKDFSFGLITYPVLMAADILSYKASYVPVGSDQLHQLQLCRDLASRFNQTYKTDIFPQCEWLLSEFPRIRSLRNPEVKMSKSDPSEKSRINLDDDADALRLKIKQAVTDSISKVYYSEERPGVANLIDIHSSVTGLSRSEIEALAKDMDTGQYKQRVADAVVTAIEPISTKINTLRNDQEFVGHVLHSGKLRATEIASETLEQVKSIIGLK